MDKQLDTRDTDTADTRDTMEACFRAIYIDAPECKQEWQELDRKFQPQSPSLYHPRLLLLSGVRIGMRVCMRVRVRVGRGGDKGY